MLNSSKVLFFGGFAPPEEPKFGLNNYFSTISNIVSFNFNGWGLFSQTPKLLFPSLVPMTLKLQTIFSYLSDG